MQDTGNKGEKAAPKRAAHYRLSINPIAGRLLSIRQLADRFLFGLTAVKLQFF
jgi:hypothetical protein